MSQLPALLFDLDGTLTDPAPGFLASIRHALTELGRPIPEDDYLHQFIGPPLRNSMGILIETDDPGLIEKGVELYRWRLNNGGKFEAAVHAGMTDVLKYFLEKGHPLFVCTGKPECVATEIVHHFELAPFFRKVYGAKLDGRHADKADLIRHLWTEEKIPSPEGVMIGDTVFDIEAGKANRLGAVGVSWGYGKNEDLLAAGADYLVNSTDELIEKIEELV